MKIKNYDTPTACKKNYYFSEKKKAIAFLLDCLNIRKLSQSKPQLSLHNHVRHKHKKLNINNYKIKNIMKKRILLIALIGMSFGINAQITDTGSNVGIGTNGPDTPIEIYKTSIDAHTAFLKITMPSWSASKNKNKSIVWDGGQNIITAGIGASYDAGMVNMDFHSFYNAGEKTDSDVIMRIKGNGNIGIGTTTPSNPLDIEKNKDGDVLLEVTNLNTGNKARSGIVVGKSNGKRTFLFSTSNNYNVVSSWKNSGVIGTDSGLLGGLVIRTSTGKIRFQPKGITDKMVLDENGNLGIGTTSPDSKLTVAGNIHSQEVKVTINAGADFVFNKDYKLPSLESVEKYVKENKHLPEIASEKEMKENGLLLAEMNIKLLQKIEELTLYTIKQQKELESLKSMNSKLLELQQRLEKLEKK